MTSCIADDVMLLYLPLAHNFGRLMHLAGPYVGFTTAFLADPLAVATALPQVRPTILPSVPRVYEKVHTAVSSAFAETSGVKRRIVQLGAPRRAAREHAPPGGASAAWRTPHPACVWPTALSSVTSATGSAAGCERRSPAARRSPARSPSSSTRSGSGSSRDTG